MEGQLQYTQFHELVAAGWEHEQLPAEWTKSLLVPILKAGIASVFNNYRGISLISVPCKVFSLIIQKRLAAWVDSQLLEQQCGFRAGRSCNDAIFSMRLLQEHAIRNKQPMLAAFVDLSKAYDSLDRELAWQCFRHRGMSEKLLKMLQLLHSRTTCAVKGDHVLTSSWFEICTGFKQGNVNAPMFFNLFNQHCVNLDTVLREMQPELVRTGLAYFYWVLREMPSRNLPNNFGSILFADDMAIVAPSTEQMQIALETADTGFSRWGLEMSIKKTKVMAVGCDVVPSHFHLERGSIETVPCFKYLGSYLAKDGGIGLEVTHRIKAAACAFHKLKAFWKDAHVTEAVKLKVHQAIVQATLLYACETWAIGLETVSSLKVFQMQCLRRISRISKMEHVSNAQILARAILKTVHDPVQQIAMAGPFSKTGKHKVAQEDFAQPLAKQC